MENNRIDINYISEFVNMAGKEPLIEAIGLFKTSLFEYMDNCRIFFSKGVYDDAAKEMHKIKGAASSIGLCAIMPVAKEYELEIKEKEGEFPLEEKLNDFKSEVLKDLEALENFVNNK